MESYLKYLLSFYVTTEVLYPDSTKLIKKSYLKFKAII